MILRISVKTAINGNIGKKSDMINDEDLMLNIVYGLADSRNDLIYYVGKTTVGKKRPLQHLKNSHSKDVNEWIESVHDDWGDINVVVLEEVEDLNFLSDREKYWIGYYYEVNPNLLNKKDFPKTINKYEDCDMEKFRALEESIFNVSEIIKRRRIALGLKQADLAELSGMNRWTISQIENGQSISLSSLKNIVLALRGEEIKLGDYLMSCQRIRN